MRKQAAASVGMGWFLALCLVLCASVSAQAFNTDPPASTVKLIFIHHSTGGNWLADPAHNSYGGDLGEALMNNNYFVSGTNYGWGYGGIGDRTDIGQWWDWFRGPDSAIIMDELYDESGQNLGGFGDWPRGSDPGGENAIVMFKSCFPNSHLGGSPSDPIPPIESNPLRGEDAWSEHHTLSNAKGIYIDLLNYFETRQDKMFVVITPPPLSQGSTSAQRAANARAFNSWLMTDWLADYPHNNVHVFGFYNVLTSNGGSTRIDDPDTNDLGWADGNHHRYRDGIIEYMQTVDHNYLAYWSDDDHPSRAGNEKATGEYIDLLNIFYHCWQGSGECPGGGGPTCTLTCTATVPGAALTGENVTFQGTGTATNCSGSPAYAWAFGDGGTSNQQNPVHAYAAEGTYTWTLTVTIEDQTCTRTGTITISDTPTCTLTCTASVPSVGAVGAAVAFQATGTAANCTGSPAFAWTFGDGGSSAQQNPGHTYAAAGTYTWTLTVTVDDQTCTQTGTITITSGDYDTYYVRPDGGDADQCTGVADAPYPGSGTNQPCAWDHPFRALPPGDLPRISGGDTLIIADGSYMMGYGAPGAGNCDQAAAYDCVMPPVPSGPDAAHPTRIVGESAGYGCPTMPELWATERAYHVFNLTGSSNVAVACLEITDHSECIEFHNDGSLPCSGCTVACERNTPPYGMWGAGGIWATDSSNVRLQDLNIHGLAESGIHCGRLSNWTLNRVNINANGWAGWNGDVWDNSSNWGTLRFQDVEIAWNGCAESWPGEAILPDTCWGQHAGGYGDGLGTADTGGDWIFEDCHIHDNTSDGLDLLYLDTTGSLEVRRLTAEGNAGNQLKVSGDAVVENSVLVGNCASFEGAPLMDAGDHCRAGGNTVAFDLHRGSSATLVNSTIGGEGDCLMEATCNDAYDADPDCDGTESIFVANTLFSGDTDWAQPFELTCFYWYDEGGLPFDPLDMDYNLVWNVKNAPCRGIHDMCGVDPLLVDDSLDAFDGHLQEGSPAIDAGTNAGAPTDDRDGNSRDGHVDIGAYEYQGGTTCTVVCTASADPTSGAPPLIVNFSSSATADGCTTSATFSWDFGDGGTSSDQYPSHTYDANGSYTWTMTAQADGVTCVETGTITVSDGTILPGDCDGNGSVSIGEVQRAINMFLGSEAPGCGVDCDGNGVVSVGEVQRVINGFLGAFAGCP